MLLYLFQTNQLLLPEMEKPSLPVHQNNPGETHGTLTVDCDSDCKSVEARSVGAGLIMGGENGHEFTYIRTLLIKGFCHGRPVGLLLQGQHRCYCYKCSRNVTVSQRAQYQTPKLKQLNGNKPSFIVIFLIIPVLCDMSKYICVKYVCFPQSFAFDVNITSS